MWGVRLCSRIRTETTTHTNSLGGYLNLTLTLAFTVTLGLVMCSLALLTTSIFDYQPLTQTMIPMPISDTVFHVASLIDLRPDSCDEMSVYMYMYIYAICFNLYH